MDRFSGTPSIEDETVATYELGEVTLRFEANMLFQTAGKDFREVLTKSFAEESEQADVDACYFITMDQDVHFEMRLDQSCSLPNAATGFIPKENFAAKERKDHKERTRLVSLCSLRSFVADNRLWQTSRFRERERRVVHREGARSVNEK
jgi:hypothetical protein